MITHGSRLEWPNAPPARSPTFNCSVYNSILSTSPSPDGFLGGIFFWSLHKADPVFVTRGRKFSRFFCLHVATASISHALIQVGGSGPSSQGVQVVHIERLPRNPSPPHMGALANTHFPRKSFRCGGAGNESGPQSGPCIPRLRTPVAGPFFFSPDSRISLLKGKKTGHEIVGKA